MHMLSWKHLNSVEMKTVQVSRNLQRSQKFVDKCKQTRKSAEHINDLDPFVTVQFVQDTLPICSFGQFCEDQRFELTSGKNHILWKKLLRYCATLENHVPIVVPGQLRLPVLVRNVRPQHLNGRPQCGIILLPSQRGHEVGVNVVRTREDLEQYPNQIKKDEATVRHRET